ncbi:MAG: hypothetical protein KDC87_08845 [Planctomycetes bacterium]|nr:hypothetical protein [Planctomycetota bacterium]MCB9872090.1 hypothetical protein [Planctomycetota bacterium]
MRMRTAMWVGGLPLFAAGSCMRGAAPSPRAAGSPNYAAHVAELRTRLARAAPDSVFHMVVQAPFVVLGDESVERVRQRATDVVAWAVELLKREYFAKDPDHILDVWLFRNRGSYRKHCLALFGERPTTPFGFYSPQHRALVMNIATGGGTLVHEIVHPYVHANFPACPAWFNEGLGSLYEQSAERDGRIVGRTNWRLAGLQQAIRSGALPSFRKLTATTEDEFYREDPGSNYGQARYLCYYLQEKGLLRRFYHAFVAAQRTDPTGYATLQATLGAPDMAEFQRDWERYVLALRFDG